MTDEEVIDMAYTAGYRAGYRHRYAEPLPVWAALHAEPDDRPAPATVTETCRYHGDWQAAPHDRNADCPQCAANDDQGARRDAEYDLHTAAWAHQHR